MASNRPIKTSQRTTATTPRTSGKPEFSASFGLADRLALKDELLAIFRSPDYKPPVLPAVALELINLTRKPNASYEGVVRVVEKDPLLVANVLKLAQSPMYGVRLRAQSLQDALSRLGMNALRDMVWQVVLGLRIFRAPAYASTMERIQSHSTFTAYAARVVAAEVGTGGEHAFLCGLLHDVGWSGALVTASENMAPPSAEVLFPVIDSMHAAAGTAMAGLWGLSPEIAEVIALHHEIERSNASVPALVPILCVAEYFADELNFAITEKSDGTVERIVVDENLVGRFESAVTTLRLAPKLDRIRTRMAEIAAQLSGAAVPVP